MLASSRDWWSGSPHDTAAFSPGGACDPEISPQLVDFTSTVDVMLLKKNVAGGRLLPSARCG